MNLVFVVERPTQFEVPFYRYAAHDPKHRLEVWFTGARGPVEDPELGRTLDWGFDLRAGYLSVQVPAEGRAAWLRARLAETAPDLLIVNGYTQRAYLDAARAGRREGVPVALRLDSVRFPGDPPLGPLRRALFRFVLAPRYARFLAVGSLTRRYLEGVGLPAARVGAFPYPTDVAGFAAAAARGREQRAAMRAGWGLRESDFAVVAVSKLVPRETPWALLEASAQLPENEKISLLLAGDGPQRPEVEQFVATRGLAARVVRLGYVPYPELPALYAACDLFVHAPREERWGVSVGEALACGLPVVATARVGAGYDLLAEGDGFLIPNDPTRLAAALRAARVLAPAARAQASAARLAAVDHPAVWQALLAAAAQGAGT